MNRQIKNPAPPSKSSGVEKKAHEKADPAVGRDGEAPNHDRVALLAYEIWLSRGRPHGADQDDWFEAERRLRGQLISAPRSGATAPSR